MVQSLDRGMKILSILEHKDSAGVTEIAEELGVNKSTASRLLDTLRQHDMVQMDPVTKNTVWAFIFCIWGKASSGIST